MREIILNFPKQFKIGSEAAKNIKLEGSFENIVICGVGGSALPGSLLLDITDVSIPVFIHRDYGLPKIASEKSLIICISFSGNTEETLSAYQEAIEKNYKVIVVSTGGKLQELTQENNTPVAIVPNDCLQSRFGIGYLLAATLKILANCKVIEDKTKEILEAAENLKPATFKEQGKKLAKKLAGKIPIIYSSNNFKSLSRIWKIKFNENSKVMAFWNYFPELNHNEMVGLTNTKSKNENLKYYFIILRNKDDHPRILKRMELTAELIKESETEVDFIEMTGETKLEKIFNALLLGDWVSYYLALAYGQDPVPVKIVEEFKKRMG